ncbi:uncharacterized protein LOC129903455 isoform X2 [Solanum dulcamara]|uniref:uncharacterized protein LOC129903455 isoform X2 n=1 Tax=Solanum dulcamara TaxID=45834 RepID=UPI002485BB34|nr:uncharacterized protein LOC129903455 isoform X2 [Solanum dulcamara]
MPPEPLPWDRKDFFKERKHDRSELARWRETTPHHHYTSSRWLPDFRSRGSSGHGKQGSWHMYPEEPGHGFMPSRSNEKIVEDESCRQSRGDGGKYGKNSRENRSSGQRDWRGGHSWEAASASGSARQNDATNDQRSLDVVVPHSLSHPHSEHVNTCDQSHPREQHNKSGSGNRTASTGQRFERESSLGSVEWRPLKWTRSGSLSSRGSLSHSGSSKSMGVDSNETKPELQLGNSKAVQDATVCVTSAAPSEETTSRKKPRLGWGEGLAKYEKKKVEGPEDNAVKVGASISGDSVEPGHSQPLNLLDRSPRVTVFPDCPSPATPSSVACSSSPGLEDKQLVKATNIDQDVGNLCGSPSVVSQYYSEGSGFNLENWDLAQISNLNSSINELLQSEDPSFVDSGFMRSTAVNKLLVWKSDITKALEKTEVEIDSLENELKTLISGPENIQLVPSAPCFPPKDCYANSHEDQGTTSNIASKPVPLLVDIPDDLIGEEEVIIHGNEQIEVKVEDIDSPGSATSKFVELPSEKNVEPVDAMKHDGMLISDDSKSRRLNVNMCSFTEEKAKSRSLDVKLCNFNEEKARDTLACWESSQPTASYSHSVSNDSLNCGEDALYNLILASNKDSAQRAFEVFKNLLPASKCSFDFSRAVRGSSLQIDPAVKERFVKRKQFQQFKEKIIALKYRVHQHLWKEDIRMLSVRRFRAKSQKKFDFSLRPVQTGHQKHRSTVRSRFFTTVGSLSLVPSSEILNFASRLLSELGAKVYRNTLRMPALILDQKERMMSRFISKNSLVEDPCAVEEERGLINPWTSKEREIFIDKLATFGKDFKMIASFLDHKTTADCIEFYYKNHKSDCFDRTRRKPDYSKQAKVCSANTYLVASSGKRWNREANSVSLDILGAASAIAANEEDSIEIQPKGTSKYTVRMVNEYKTSRLNELERSNSLDVCHSERETVAADVLAGICGSLSSEAMSSCITSSVDPGEGNQEAKHQKVGSSTRLPRTPEVIQSGDDETCSDESCGEMDPTDWTDEEKSTFIQAVSAYGKDFVMVSRCVGTRSRDQCKIFFSKARKCLGLDKILPGSGNLERQDVNGGSDPDACVMETKLLCNEKSSSMLEDVSDLCMKAGILKPDLTSSDDKDGAGELDSVDTELMSKNSVQVNCHVDKQEVEFNRDCEIQIGVCIGNGRGDENMVTVSREGVEIDGDALENGLPDIPSPNEVSAKNLGEKVRGVVSSPEHDSKDRKAEIAEVSRSNCSLEDRKSNMVLSVNNSRLAAARGGGLCPLNGSRNMSHLESDSDCKLDVNRLESNISVPRKQMSEASNAEILSELELENVGDKQCENATQSAEQPLPSTSQLTQVESCQILGSYLLGESALTENGDPGRRASAALQEIQVGRNLQFDTFSTTGCFLQKCNGTIRGGCSVSDLLISNREQTGGSSNVEKPCRNGDVKLFGQILSKPCPKANPSSSAQRCDGSNQQLNVSSDSFTASHSLEGNSATAKFERNNFLGSENHPVRSFGFWDGNRIQTGFSSLPDSAILLAKYPAAFGRDSSSNNGVAAADYQVYRNRDVQPFTIEMKQRQDAVFSEMQRRNGFDVMQQQARGVVVGRGGILQCTAVSDPVAAIKMHYAKSEQFSGQAASIIREDDSWRSKGDVSR